jgi:hypothetical protein
MTAVPSLPADRQRHPLVVLPEDDPVFRLAQLILFMDSVLGVYPDGTDVERLAVFSFLAAHPLLLAREESDPDRMHLLMAGFDDRGLSYTSVAHRYVTHRTRVPQDLALLVAYGLVAASAPGRVAYRLTNTGRATAGQFTAVYARSYATAARIVVARLRRMSDRGLRDRMQALIRMRKDHPVVAIRDLVEVDDFADSDPSPDRNPARPFQRADTAPRSAGRAFPEGAL